MKSNFTAIYYTTELGDTPAAVNMVTGELYLNLPIWDKMPKEQRTFVLLHELGHYYLQTRDELKADAFAFEHYKKLGFSLKQSIYALSENLTGKSEEHFKRVANQAARAKKYDNLTNFTGVIDPADPTGNTTLVDPATFQAMVTELENEVAELESQYNSLSDEIAGLGNDVSFLVKDFNDGAKVAAASCEKSLEASNAACNDLRKVAKNKRSKCKQAAAAAYQECLNSVYGTKGDFDTRYNAKIENKQAKIEARVEVKKMRAERKAMLAEAKAYKKITKANGKSYKMMTNANANMTLASQGIDSRGNMVESGMKAASSVADSVSAIWGGGTGNAYGSGGQAAGQTSQTTLIIIAAVVIAAIYFLTQKKKG